MTEENINNLDNESLVTLLQALEQLDEECILKGKDMECDCNE